MKLTPDAPKQSSRSGRIAALLVAALALYPLSEGPVWRMHWKGHVDASSHETAYAPLDYLAANSPKAHRLRSAYLRLWYDPWCGC